MAEGTFSTTDGLGSKTLDSNEVRRKHRSTSSFADGHLVPWQMVDGAISFSDRLSGERRAQILSLYQDLEVEMQCAGYEVYSPKSVSPSRNLQEVHQERALEDSNHPLPIHSGKKACSRASPVSLEKASPSEVEPQLSETIVKNLDAVAVCKPPEYATRDDSSSDSEVEELTVDTGVESLPGADLVLVKASNSEAEINDFCLQILLTLEESGSLSHIRKRTTPARRAKGLVIMGFEEFCCLVWLVALVTAVLEIMHYLRLMRNDLKSENILLISPEYIKVPDYKLTCVGLIGVSVGALIT
ncbi:hypothetical protein RHGRI_007522 [Rhododendron griersonianum]|uniref:Protein kinase domain-containing protein n=1 Tax=Rhododendron griersonianum TaxID=479676 RepID=A0AAV6KYP6_9ERIC|nr:hypothetical protein RHGRI_007522 [Rhododendron griersonianum]